MTQTDLAKELAIVYFLDICFFGSIALLIYGFREKKNNFPCSQTLILAALMLSASLGVFIFMFVLGVLGIGPEPR